jgi:hypothetical protein
MRNSSIVLITALLVALGGCNQKFPNAGQYDQFRVALSEDKDFREKYRAECYRDFKKYGASFRRLFSVLLNASEANTARLTCDRLIQGIIDKRLTYNDVSNVMRLEP